MPDARPNEDIKGKSGAWFLGLTIALVCLFVSGLTWCKWGIVGKKFYEFNFLQLTQFFTTVLIGTFVARQLGTRNAKLAKTINLFDQVLKEIDENIGKLREAASVYYKKRTANNKAAALLADTNVSFRVTMLGRLVRKYLPSRNETYGNLIFSYTMLKATVVGEKFGTKEKFGESDLLKFDREWVKIKSHLDELRLAILADSI